MPIRLISGGGGSVSLNPETTASAINLTVPAVNGSIVASAVETGMIPKTVLPTGCILQVVQTVFSGTTSVAAGGTERQITQLNANITPNSISNKVLITLNLNYGSSATTYGGYFKRNGTVIGVGDASGSRQRVGFGMALCSDTNQVNSFYYQYLDSPASTSSVAYTFWVNNDNGNSVFFNRSVNDSDNSTGKRCISTVTLTEIVG